MAEIPTNFAIPWGSYLELGSMVWDLASQLFGIPDPLDLFISLFNGRPTMQATQDIASIYNSYSSPTLKLLAMGAAASMRAGVPLSQSSGDPTFGPFFGAALDIEQAIRWGLLSASTRSVETATLASCLNEAGNPGQNGNATLTAVQQAWDALQAGNPIGGVSPGAQFATWAASTATDPGSLMVIGFAQRYLSSNQPAVAPPAKPAAPPAPPPPLQQDPATFGWFGTCTEVTDCADLNVDTIYLGQQAVNIAHSIRVLAEQFATNPPDQCCQQLAYHLNAINVTLQDIAQAMPTHPQFHNLVKTCEAVKLHLHDIKLSIDAVPTAITAASTNVATALAPLATIAAAPSPNAVLEQILSELQRFNSANQVPATWITSLIDSGAVPADFSALLQGTTWGQVLAEAGHILAWLWGAGLEANAKLIQIRNEIFGPIGNVIWDYFTAWLPGIDAAIGPVMGTLVDTIKSMAAMVDKLVVDVFGTSTALIVKAYESGIGPMPSATLADVQAITSTLLARCLEFGASAHMIATLPELAYFTKQLGLNQTAAFVAELAGFREVLINTHRPFLVAKLGRPATYAYNREYPTALPGAQAALEMWARRILDSTDTTNAIASAGFAPNWANVMQIAAYRPVSPRALATLLEDQPIDTARMTAILEDNAYSPANVSYMLDEFTYQSTKTVRNAYVQEALTAYGKGVMSDQDLSNILTSLGWSTAAQGFVTERAALARSVTVAAKVEAQVLPLLRQGSITAAQATQQLEAAGLQSWYVDLEVTLAETQAEIHAAKLAATEAERLERERQRNLVRAAIENYHSGSINLAELTTGITAAGIDPVVAATVTSVAQAQQVGKLRLTYGKLLQPQAAAILREQVAAIGRQTEDQLISLDTATTQLQALGLSAGDVNALIARYAASLKTSPGKAQLFSPVTRQAGV